MQAKELKSTLFIVAEHGYSLACDKTEGIHVGIWWQNGHTLVAFAQPLGAIKQASTMIDSELCHADAWDVARRTLGVPADLDYFAIPRGRVLWSIGCETGIVYHGNATKPNVLRTLAKLFGLPSWEARLDDHYLIGSTLDAYLDHE